MIAGVSIRPLGVQVQWAGARCWGDLAWLCRPWPQSSICSASRLLCPWLLCGFHPAAPTRQNFLKHSKSIAEFLPSPFLIPLLHLFSPNDKAHLDMSTACALQIRNQSESHLQYLWAKANRATDKIRILVPSLKPWLRISVQISLGNYTEICFIQPIAQDLWAHTSSQFVICAN